MENDFFGSDEFRETLRNYEEGVAAGHKVYLDSEEYIEVADYYMSVGRYLEAETCVDQALKEYGDDDELLVLKSSCCICLKKYEKVEPLLDKMDPASPDVLYQRGQLAYALYHDFDEATRYWKEWMDSIPNSSHREEMERDSYTHIVASIIELSDASLMGIQDDDHDFLVQWLDEYESKFSPLGESDFDETIADTLIPISMPELVIKWYNKILERRPYMPRGWSRLAVAYIMDSKPEQAVEAADFALAVNPDDIDALVAKANALFSMKAWEETLEVYKVIREKGGGKIHNINMAVTYFKIGDPTKAFLCLKELKAEMDSQVNKLKNSSEGGRQQSVSAALDTMDFNEYLHFYVQICLEISDKLRENGRYVESNEYLKAVLQYEKKNYLVYLSLAENCFINSEWEQGLEYFKKALDYGGEEHRIETGVKFSLCLLACGYVPFAKKVIQSCKEVKDKTDTEKSMLNMAYVYLYLYEDNKELFVDNFVKVLADDPFAFNNRVFNEVPVVGDEILNQYLAGKMTIKEVKKILYDNFELLRDSFMQEMQVFSDSLGSDEKNNADDADHADDHDDL